MRQLSTVFENQIFFLYALLSRTAQIKVYSLNKTLKRGSAGNLTMFFEIFHEEVDYFWKKYKLVISND